MSDSIRDFVIENLRFSYSSVSGFDTCKYAWMLTYIEGENREDNVFAQYGNVIHGVLEAYWKGEKELDELAYFYELEYPRLVTADPPPYPQGMMDKYFEAGTKFFESFDIKPENYDVLFVEDKIDAEYRGIKLVVKPDLVIRNKKTGEVLMLDYKTSKPMKGKNWDKVKMAGYEKQMLLYAYFLEKHLNIKIDKIALLFTRLDSTYYVDITPEKYEEVLNWFYDTIQEIKKEEEFKASPEEKYFCSHICSRPLELSV